MARTPIATPGFLDRLGDRVIVSDPAGGDLEVLRLRLDLTADPRFETSLASRAAELSTFDHRGVARVRGTSRLAAGDGRLAIVSDAPKGWRLSEVLQAAEHENRQIHTSAVLFVLRQVAATLTALHAAGPEVSHGALGPDRVVLIPGGRVLVVEYVPRVRARLAARAARRPAVEGFSGWPCRPSRAPMGSAPGPTSCSSGSSPCRSSTTACCGVTSTRAGCPSCSTRPPRAG